MGKKNPRNIFVEAVPNLPMEEQPAELVERKGVGHPDSICDAIMEAVSVELCRAYLDHFGKVLHHNIDKGLLVAGRTTPALGGGRVDEPMRLIFGDRATYEYKGVRIPVGEIAEATAKAWLRGNLRFVDPDVHVVFQNEIKPGSPELTDIFEREVVGANDTSAGVGYAPLSETEQLVLAVERYLNSTAFKAAYPEAGEDIKVMGYRFGSHLTLTVALAFVDRFIPDEKTYFERKAAIREDLQAFVDRLRRKIERVTVDINTLDDPRRGARGMYLTVLGTSAEGGDGGQVGRGNRVNGVIAFNRPSTTEAAAGKNPVSHVGKIYNLLSHEIANRIYIEVPGIREVTVWLCSQIGQPIDRPLMAAAQVILEDGVALEDVQDQVNEVIDRELAGIHHFTNRLIHGELTVW
ncbi:MAG TPA: methionine adenosyltransferase [Anaerolineales bacterium]|nr:methionine adenosyltransferase [Anaerolineales bacterium]